tara:strand:- start:272 stop:1615 length:1344 start_codon:yes stop_codon:yes gene_type:complete
MAINLLNNSEVAGTLTIRADGTSSPADSNKLIYKGIGDFGAEITRGELQFIDDDVAPNGSNFLVKVSDDNGDLQTYLTVDAYGQVGIGTTTPGQTLEVNGGVKISTINNASSDTDKFLVSDSGVVKYRTGAEVRSDIGAGTGNGSVTSVAVTVGTGLDVSGSPITGSGTIDIDLDLSELASATGAMASLDNFVISSSGGSNRKSTPNLIGLSLFNNDAGFTTTSGTVTSVTVGTGLDVSSGTTTPDITLDLTEITLSAGLDSTATGLSLDLNELAAVDTASNTIEKFIIVDDEGESASATPADLQTVDTFFKNSQTIINANWSDDTSTTSYINIPLNYIIDSTSSQYYNHFACPTAGTVKYIMMMHVSGTFTGPFTTQLRVVKNGSAADTSGELTPSNASADGSYIEYAPNTSFAKGDRLRFAYSKSATGQYWRGTVASIIIEFENK